MDEIRRLLFADVAPGREFHAARVTLEPGQGLLHTHDFGETFYVLDGAGTHEVNGESLPLRAGHLVRMRPTDRHTYRVPLGGTLQFINVAYPDAVWREFCALARVAPGDAGPLPPTSSVPDADRGGCAQAFAAALGGSHDGPTRLMLCRFWADVTPLLAGEAAPPPEHGDGPAWLRRTQAEMAGEENLRAGFARLVELSGVSAGHLSRTLKAHTGQTPTAWVNAARVRRAARRLATTDDPIFDIADDCGFENLSYFYRLFRLQCGLPPGAYRQQARRSVAP